MEEFDPEVKADHDALVEALTEAGGTVDNDTVSCPFHADARPSGSIYEKDGVWRYKCHSCKINEDVYGIKKKASGTTPVAKPAKAAPSVFPTVKALLAAIVDITVEQVYLYTNPTGALDMLVIRCRDRQNRKTFRQASPTEGGWCFRKPEGLLPLYNRKGILAADRVIVVEGEKAADALIKAGYCATTSSGGAGKAALTDWTPLNGKQVILWPDNDDAGAAHIDDVQGLLEDLATRPTLQRVDPVLIELPKKGDAVEFLEI
jgi:hypothetical protein